MSQDLIIVKRNVKLFTNRTRFKHNSNDNGILPTIPKPVVKSELSLSSPSSSPSSSTEDLSDSSSSGEVVLQSNSITKSNPNSRTNSQSNLPIIFEMSEDNSSNISFSSNSNLVNKYKISKPIKTNDANDQIDNNNNNNNIENTKITLAHLMNNNHNNNNNNDNTQLLSSSQPVCKMSMISSQNDSECATNNIDELDKKSIKSRESSTMKNNCNNLLNQRKTPRFPVKKLHNDTEIIKNEVINHQKSVINNDMKPRVAPKPNLYQKNKLKPVEPVITDLDDEPSPTPNTPTANNNESIIKSQMFKTYSKDELKYAVTINNQASPASVKKSQEMKGNINKMDRTIDRVSEDIVRIDSAIDKLNTFNRTFMDRLELLSDSELSSVVGVQSNAAQTEPYIPQPNKLQPNNQNNGNDNDEGDDSSDSSTEKESSDDEYTSSDEDVVAPNNRHFPRKARNVAAIKNGNKPPVKRQDSELSSLPESSLCEEPEKRCIEGQLKYFHRQIRKNAGQYKQPGLIDGPKRLVVDHAPQAQPLPRPRSNIAINNQQYRLSNSSTSTESSGGGHFEHSTKYKRNHTSSASNSYCDDGNSSVLSYYSGLDSLNSNAPENGGQGQLNNNFEGNQSHMGARNGRFQKAGAASGRFNKKGAPQLVKTDDDVISLSGKPFMGSGTLNSNKNMNAYNHHGNHYVQHGHMTGSRSYTSLNQHFKSINNHGNGAGPSTRNSDLVLLDDADILELVELIRQHLELGYYDRIKSIFKALIRDQNHERIEDIIEYFNEPDNLGGNGENYQAILWQIANEAGYKMHHANTLPHHNAANIRPADSIFDMRLSRTDLQNKLRPGLSMSSLAYHDTLPSAQQHTRMVLWRADLEELLPPAMKPPPRPLPSSSLVKGAVVSAEAMEKVDNHVAEVLQFEPTTFTELISFLTRDCSNDVEKVRAIFRWITMYDMKYLTFDPAAPNESLIGMLRAIKSGQMTYNELFSHLCRYSGIHCQFISGYSKGAGYRPGMTLKDNRMFRNVWTAVYVAGAWRFVNCNWGARYLTSHYRTTASSSLNGGAMGGVYSGGVGAQTGTLRSQVDIGMGTLNSNISLLHQQSPDEQRVRCDEFYFLTDPKQHIFEHFPDKKRWQLLNRPITLEQFMSLPIVKSPFFNANLSFKKNYPETLNTKNGKVTIKINMPKALGVSCRLENRADGSILRGLTLVQIVDFQTIVITAAPSQPGKFYLSVYVDSDWKKTDEYATNQEASVNPGHMEMACSFQVHCSEHNYDRLVTGRFPEVGVLGNTPAATNYGLSINPGGVSPFVVWKEKKTMKLPVTYRPGLRIGHKMMSYDRTGQNSASCDSYALLQRDQSAPGKAQYHLRFPVDAFYCLTIFASSSGIDNSQDLVYPDSSGPLECVYRLLIDARKAQDSILPYPRQSSRWVDCTLLNPIVQALPLSPRRRPVSFCLLTPPGGITISVAVVINDDPDNSWQELSLSDANTGLYKGKIDLGDKLGRLSVYAQFRSGDNAQGSSAANDDEEEYIKLLDFVLVEPTESSHK